MKESWTTAESLLSESIEICNNYQNPLGKAKGIRELGSMHWARNRGETGRRMLGEALEVFEQLGAHHEVERTQELLDA